MKAIIITFEGAIKDDNILASLLASCIGKQVNTEDVDVHILSDIDVTNALIAKCLTPSAIAVDRPANPQIAVVKDFCKKIIASIGSPALKTRELLNSELCKFLVQQNREVISVPVSIIAKVNTTSAYYEHRKVLKEYGLSALPELLRDVNPIFKFY
jgi:hypothetical protein